MHPRTKQLLDDLDAHRVALRVLVDSVPADLRERQPPTGGWSVAGVLEHLGLVESRITGLLAQRLAAARAQGLAAPGTVTPPAPELDTSRVIDRSKTINASEATQPTQGLDTSAAWAALERSRARLRELLVSADGEDLSTIQLPHPVFGPLDFYGWVTFLGAHEGRHAAQIREAAAALGAY